MIKICSFSLIFIASLSVLAQSPTTKKLSQGYYLVVASFSPEHEDYATRLSAALNMDSRLSVSASAKVRKYWSVYYNQSNTRDECGIVWNKTKSKSGFKGAWVHTIKKAKD